MDNGFTKALKGGAVQVHKNIDRRDVPRYGIEEAARCLGMSAATLDSWVHGRKYPTSAGQRFFRPLIELTAPGNLSFYNLVEAHILLSTRKKHKVEMPSIRRAIDYVRKTYPSAHPLLSESFCAASPNIHRFELSGPHAYRGCAAVSVVREPKPPMPVTSLTPLARQFASLP